MTHKMQIRFLLVFFIVLFQTHFAYAQKLDKIVAVVNSDIITEGELGVFMKLEAMDTDRDSALKNTQEFRKNCLERMIEDRLILQAAKDAQVKVDEKLIDERIKEVKERAGGEAALQDALKAEGLSLVVLKEKFRNQLMILTLIQREVKDKVHVSPKEVTEYFNQHQDQFATPDTAKVDSIFVTNKETLKKVQEELVQDKDFEVVAKTYSEKESLGKVSRGQLKKELEDIIFSLKVGERSGSVEAGGGYYIFFLKERLASFQEKLENVKEVVTVALEKTKIQQRLKEWVEGLKDKAYISIRE